MFDVGRARAVGVRALGDHAHRLGGDSVLAVGGGDDAPLGLRHDLARDRDDVAVVRDARERVAQDAGQVIPRPELGQAEQSEHADGGAGGGHSPILAETAHPTPSGPV